jgi:hypothetical protein
MTLNYLVKLNRLLCVFVFILIITFGATSQDTASSGYFNVHSLGRDLSGSGTQRLSYVYFNSLHGYYFSEEFGVAAGAGLAFYEDLSLLPVMISFRKIPYSDSKVGFNFDIGYTFPLSGDYHYPNDNNSQTPIENYQLEEGGLYFNPEISLLVYEGPFDALFSLGYKLWGYTESYDRAEWWNAQVHYEDKFTNRRVNLGVVIQFKCRP